MKPLNVCAALKTCFLLSVLSLAGKVEAKALNVIKDTWEGHDGIVQLAYQDDHVAIYYDEDVNKNGNITWPFKIISRGWEYLKATYGLPSSFSHDPLLYVILHAFKHKECRSSLYSKGGPQNQNQIDCGQEDEIKTTPEGSLILFQLFAHMLLFATGEKSALQKIELAIAEAGLVQLLLYDLNKFLQDPSKRLDAIIDDALKNPENGIYWLRDWYLPIYKQFGKTSVLRNFFNILRNNFNKFRSSPTIVSHKMLTLGEYVHFWSEAAGQDLYPLAKLSINNSRELYTEIVEARKTFPISNYKETMKLKAWQETWGGHGELLTLAFQDDHVAIYYDEDVNKNGNITWPFEIISQSWRYVKETYKTFGPDPLLYVILHASEIKYEDCITISYRRRILNRRNLIDCGEKGTIKATSKHSKVLHNYLYNLGPIITVYGDDNALQLINKNRNEQQEVIDLMYYDLTRFLKDPLKLLVRWKEIKQIEVHDKIYWFRDWFLPLYDQFGGASVLRNFFKLTNQSSWPDLLKKTLQKNFNLGESVHFWSGAAQKDLLPTAIHSISNSREFYDELVEARNSFSFINYTKENCTASGKVVSCGSAACAKNIAWRCNGKMECSDGSDEANCKDCKSTAIDCANGGCVDKAKVCNFINDCPFDQSDEINCADVWNPKSWLRTWKLPRVELKRVYVDNDVVIYYGPNMNLSSLWISQIYAKAWFHVKRTYGNFGRNPTLAVVLSAYDGAQTNCDSYPSTVSKFFYRNCIDCGRNGWALDEYLNFKYVLSILVNLIRDETKAKNNPDSIDTDVSGIEMNYIIHYDLYVELNGVTAGEVSTWKESQLNRTWEDVHFFRDWFLPIYETYGGSIALGNFYHLTKSQWGKALKQQESRKYLNVGEFVHFWSGAAGADLLPIALQIFNDSSFLYSLLTKAKENFLLINYTATQCREGQFRCKKDFVCIRENWRCNGIQECSDNSDEKNCEGTDGETKTSHVVPIVVSIVGFGLLVASIGVGWKILSDRSKIQNLSQQIRNLTMEEVNDFLKGNGNLNRKDANGLIHSMPFISDCEIDPEDLIFDEGRVLGSGEFGVVKEGKLLIDTKTRTRNTDQTVAVKMMKPNAKVEHFKAFLVEIKIMAFLGHHENIVSLLATATNNIKNCEVFVALEFCSNGDLLRFLRASCDQFQDLFCPKLENVTSVVFTNEKNIEKNSDVDFVTSNVPKTVGDARNSTTNSQISTVDLLKWSRQIANGMNYLATKKVIHGDLAARNILLTENKTAKISDFGLSHQLINYDIYRKTSKSPLPWRWLAIESLSSRSFSVHSDVWAFGVTLWEIFTLGQVPFPERRWDRRYINDLANGMRPNSPQFGNDEIYNLMMSCMRMIPSERIPFCEIILELQSIKMDLLSDSNLPSTSHGASSSIYSRLQ